MVARIHCRVLQLEQCGPQPSQGPVHCLVAQLRRAFQIRLVRGREDAHVESDVFDIDEQLAARRILVGVGDAQPAELVVRHRRRRALHSP